MPRVAPLLAFLLLPGCLSFSSEETIPPTLSWQTHVRGGNTSAIVFWFNVSEAQTVSAAWRVEDGGLGSACVHRAEGVEAWLQGRGNNLAAGDVCDAHKPEGYVRGTLPQGAYGAIISAYRCPALDCRLSAGFNGPSGSTLSTGIARDDPWLLVVLDGDSAGTPTDVGTVTGL